MDTEIYIRQKFFIPKGKSPIFVENMQRHHIGTISKELNFNLGDESFLWVKK
jgi:hypothetical protein